MAGKLSHGIGRRSIEIRSVDLVQSENKLDAPWSETARLELRAPLFDRYRIVADRSPEHLRQASGDFWPRQGDWPRQHMSLAELRGCTENSDSRVNHVLRVDQRVAAVRRAP